MKGSKAAKRLARRQASFDAIKGVPGPRPGDKTVWTPPPAAKAIMYHRPGSKKK